MKDKKPRSFLSKLRIFCAVVVVLQFLVYGVTVANLPLKSRISNGDEKYIQSITARKSDYLEQKMKKYTHLGGAVRSAQEVLSDMLDDGDLDIKGFLSDRRAQMDFADEFTGRFIDSVSGLDPSGIFFVLCDDNESSSEYDLTGVFLKDASVDSTNDFEWVMTKGEKSIGNRYGIPLGINWESRCTITENNKAKYKFFFEPVAAARSDPEAKLEDIGYWAESFVFDDGSNDRIISYSQPLIYDNTVFGVLGMTLSIEKLQEFAAPDYGLDGGFVLVSSRNYVRVNGISGFIQAANGVDSRKNIVAGSPIKFLPIDNSEILYKTENIVLESGNVCCAVAPLNLYGDGNFFKENKWLLASVFSDSGIFGAYDYTVKCFNFIFLTLFLMGMVMIVVCVYLFYRKMTGFCHAVEQVDVYGKPDADYKIDILQVQNLYERISTMAEERRDALLTYDGEHELCAIVLKSSGYNILEYDAEEDLLMIYYYDEESKACFSRRSVYKSFRRSVMEGKICPVEDIPMMISFIDGQLNETFRVRIYKKDYEGIRWNEVCAKSVISNEKAARVVACSKDITEVVLEEQRQRELEGHDRITDFYDSEYGYALAKKDVFENGGNYAVMIISLKNVNEFIRSEGSYYFNSVMEEIAHGITAYKGDEDIVWRMSVSDIAVYIPNFDGREKLDNVEEMLAMINRLYFSEDDPSVFCGIGIFRKLKNEQFRDAVANARYASLASEMSDYGRIVCYSDVQFDLAVRSKLDGYVRSLSTAGIGELENGYVSTENIVSYTINMLEKSKNLKKAVDVIFCKIGRSFDLDSIIFFDMDSRKKAVRSFIHWSKYDVNSDNTVFLGDGFDSLTEMLSAGENITIDKNFYVSSNELSEFVAGLRRDGKTVIMPVFYRSKPYAFFAYCFNDREIREEKLKQIMEISRVISAQVISSRNASENAARSEFFSKMSHEIRTPMNAVIGLTRVLLDEGVSDEKTRDYLHKIDSTSHYLLELINSNLDLSKIESGKMTMNNAPFDLNELIKEIDDIIRIQAEGKELSLEINGRIEHSYVIGDSLKLRQVIINLLGNSLKFTESGTLTLTVNETAVEEENALIHFSVKDTGIGIGSDDIERIFNSFEQLGGNIASKYGGTGLGLTISRAYVSMMGGELLVKSEVGKGSEFYFDLPFPVAQDNQHEIESVADRSIAGKRILLAEDDELNRSIAEKLLENDGFIVETAKDGRDALEIFSASDIGHFDAILMDIRMPVMNGLEATKEIRALERSDSKSIPIIALTANAFEEDVRKSEEYGMNGHLSKPIDIKMIRAVLGSMLEK